MGGRKVVTHTQMPTGDLIIPEGHVFQVQTRSLGPRRYVVEKKLGEGGAGIVYRGRDEQDGSPIVIKTPKTYGDKSLLSQIEERVLADIDHPNIVQYLGSVVDSYGHHIVFYEQLFYNPLLYLNSQECKKRVNVRCDRKARYIPLPPATAVDLGYELIRGVEYLHSKGLYHHDIKLDNLLVRLDYDQARISAKDYFDCLLTNRYRGVLIDAGGVRNADYLKMLNQGESTIIPPQLTPALAPPEVLMEVRRPDGQVSRWWTTTIDVYQVAIVLYALYTGHVPYSHVDSVSSATFQDLEKIIEIKRLERRGEVCPFSLDTMGRVFLKADCPFRARGSDHMRPRFDKAFFSFLKQRVDPEPEKRGTIGELKHEFEQIFGIRRNRQSTVTSTLRARQLYNLRHLPYSQTLYRLENLNRLWQAGNRASGSQQSGPPSTKLKRSQIMRGFWDPNSEQNWQ